MISAARIRIGWLLSESWNALAPPWKLARSVSGTPMRAISRLIASVACDSEVPSARLNEIVDAANCPWWFTPSGVLVGTTRANADSGTRLPLPVTT
ncbi:hypothetical protein D3C81_1788070 [compost metagenome]